MNLRLITCTIFLIKMRNAVSEIMWSPGAWNEQEIYLPCWDLFLPMIYSIPYLALQQCHEKWTSQPPEVGDRPSFLLLKVYLQRTISTMEGSWQYWKINFTNAENLSSSEVTARTRLFGWFIQKHYMPGYLRSLVTTRCETGTRKGWQQNLNQDIQINRKSPYFQLF